MKILITGGTGLIGQALIPRLLSEHQVTVLSRSVQKVTQCFANSVTPLERLDDLSHLNDFDAVINLAGEPIADKRWSEQQKGIICTSRWGLTEKLVEKIHASSTPPHTFISGSAVGYYGDQQDRAFDETLMVHADDFAQHVCHQWEKIALKGASTNTRVCLLRTGVVLSADGGALKRMMLPYKLGLGGPIGKGQQYMPWIHIDDMVGAIIHLLNTPELKGPFNCTAPEPATNKRFSQALASALKRPHVFFVPTLAIKTMMGEASHLLLDSQRALPHALEDSGFEFQHPKVEEAMQSLFK
ncbi:TIGR01777 family oxidoreductase [Salinivibrio sp. AR640]|uniref:TIGR01777 family oxidoreductase n=1 Tax=Salinivibrio sp. AR640 TaxID=1909437 RepID=UPI0009864567|nr:TIGR01777 family oxidoreductase [Salinivibrio sp. AR640]OOE95973.1 TIGR01777 family protein [Salinivibrio sp. AR640]